MPVSLAGPLTLPARLKATADLQITRLNSKRQPIPNLALACAWANDSLRCLLNQGANQIRARIARMDQAIGGTLRVDLPRMAHLGVVAGLPKLEGRLKGHGRIGGTAAQPQADLTMQGRLAYAGFAMDTLNAGFTWTGSELLIQETSFETALDISRLRMPTLEKAGLRGRLALQGRFSGPLAHLQGALAIDWSAPSLHRLSADHLRLALRLAGNEVMLDAFTLAGGGVTLRGGGRYDMGTGSGSGRMDLSAEPPLHAGRLTLRVDHLGKPGAQGVVDLVDIDAGAMAALFDTLTSVQGTVRGEITADLTPGNYAFRSNMRGERLAWQDLTMDSLQVDAAYHDGRLRLNQLALWDKGLRLSASASVPWPPSQDDASWMGRLTLDDLPLPWLRPLLGTATPQGALHGTIAGQGTVAAPRLRGTLQLEAPTWQLTPTTLPLTENRWQLTFEDSVLHIHDMAGRLRSRPFALSGQIQWEDTARLMMDMRLRFDATQPVALEGFYAKDSLALHMNIDSLDLGMLSAVVPSLGSLRGRLSSQGTVYGNPSQPRLEGSVAIDGLAYAPQHGLGPVHEGRLRLHFTHRLMTLDTLDLPMGNGRITASGQSEWPEPHGPIPILQLHLQGTRLQWVKKNQLALGVETLRLSLVNRPDHMSLSGAVALGKSRLTYPLNARTFISLVNQAQRPGETPPPLDETVEPGHPRDRQSTAVDRQQSLPEPPFGQSGALGHRRAALALGPHRRERRLCALSGPQI